MRRTMCKRRWLLRGLTFSLLGAASGCGMFGGGDHTYSSMSAGNDVPQSAPMPQYPYAPPQYSPANNAQATNYAPAQQSQQDQPADPSYDHSAQRAAERAQFDNGSDLGEGPGSQAPSINVFGEFNGVERPPQKSVAMGGFQQHTYCDEGYDADATLDPTGHYIAYASTRHSEHTNIYLQRTDGLSVTQLTSEDADDAFPTFSPDGKLIAFSSTRGGNWNLYVMSADGRNVTQITSGPSQDLHPSFSPDGTRLAYCSMGARASQWELWVVNLQTNEKKMVGVGLFPSWSPQRDRDVIAFQRARQRGSRWFSIWTMEISDGEAHSVTEVAVSGNAALVCPAWSPDGSRLAFSTIVSPSHIDGRKPQGQQDIWTVNSDGTNRHRLTDGNGINASPYWGVDSRVYFVSDRGGTECIWSTPANAPGTAIAAVGHGLPIAQSPQSAMNAIATGMASTSDSSASPDSSAATSGVPMGGVPTGSVPTGGVPTGGPGVAPVAQMPATNNPAMAQSGLMQPAPVATAVPQGSAPPAAHAATSSPAPSDSVGETDDTEIGH